MVTLQVLWEKPFELTTLTGEHHTCTCRKIQMNSGRIFWMGWSQTNRNISPVSNYTGEEELKVQLCRWIELNNRHKNEQHRRFQEGDES